MKYFFNYGTLILAFLELSFIGLALLWRYKEAKRKPKPKKNADPYRKNEYVQAHLSMIKKQKRYERELAECEADEIEAHKAEKPVFNKNLDSYLYSK